MPVVEGDPVLSESTVRRVHTHADAVAALPEGEFVERDLDDAQRATLLELRDSPIIVSTNSLPAGEDKHSDVVSVYRVNERARQIAQDWLDKRDAPCPCNHPGIRNIDGTDEYECTNDDCPRRFTRDELEVRGR